MTSSRSEEKSMTEEHQDDHELDTGAPESEERLVPQAAEPGSAGSDDELGEYSKNVQSRIKRLTEKYRKEERDREEAVRLSQQLLEENKQLKSRMQQLDTGYLSEYGTRLQTQTEAAKRAYKEAYEAGDPDRMAEAQMAMSNLAIEQQRYNSAKARADQDQRLQTERAQAPQARVAPAPVAQPKQPQPDPKAKGWAEKNTWFGEDRVMTTAAFAIHQGLIEEEGFDPNSDEYYTELDKRMRREFPHKFQSQKSGGGTQVASAGSSASRSTKQGRRTVKLTPSQVAIAKKLNVPLEEYAKYVKD
jgi:hypothetical protein